MPFALPKNLTYETLSIDKLEDALRVKINTGLSLDEADQRLKIVGKNTLPESQGTSLFTIFLNQFKSTIVIILFAAIVISLLYQHYLDVAIIFSIIVINTIVGLVQEYQAEKSIQALKEMLIPQQKVRRNGKIVTISSTDIVPGDVILISHGDTVPADARIVACTDLQLDESTLTGESMPIYKVNKALSQPTEMADQLNMLFMGTHVVGGEAEAVVVKTGAQTVLGGIAHRISTVVDEEDHFKLKTNELGRVMGAIAIASTGLLFVVGYFVRNFPLDEILIFSVAALVSALPEGLPVILTLILAMSARRMAQKKAIVRRLSATETLAVVDTIITDKTGTLTQNKMTVTELFFPKQSIITVTHQSDSLSFHQDGKEPTPSHFPLQKLLDITGACHHVTREFSAEGDATFSGDPTEIALVTLADKAINSPSYYQRKIKQLVDLPFNQENRWRASLVQYHDDLRTELFVIGSPETVIDKCTHILLPDHKNHLLNSVQKNHLQDQIDQMTSAGARVLALTYATKPTLDKLVQSDIKDLIFVGFVGIIDPPHQDTKAAIASAHQAGVDVIMATGDHPNTARAIGTQLGLISGSTTDAVMTEADIRSISDAKLLKHLDSVKIFARMTPDSKLRLAKLLQKDGRVVAMTGDGVNDAPALKQADIGIGMGKKGTQVAREASDIILSDDNFSTLVTAIEEGRTQFRNVRRTSFFYISTNLAETATLILFLLIGYPMPLLPKQILWLNIVSGGITDLALAAEPMHDNVLKVGPYKKTEPVLDRQNLLFLGLLTLTMIGLATYFFTLYQPQGLEKSRTMLFVVLSLAQIYNMINLRSLKKSIFEIGIFSSKYINIALIVSLVLMLLVTSVPILASIFEFQVLTVAEVIIAAVISLAVILTSEVYKMIKRVHIY